MQNEPFKLMVTTVVGYGDARKVVQQVLSYADQTEADIAFMILEAAKKPLSDGSIFQLVIRLYPERAPERPKRPEFPPPREGEPTNETRTTEKPADSSTGQDQGTMGRNLRQLWMSLFSRSK